MSVIYNTLYVFEMTIPCNSSSKVNEDAAAYLGFFSFLFKQPSLYCLQTEPSACERWT